MGMADRHREILRLMQSVIGRGLHISENGMQRAVELAERIIDDNNSTVRDRLRAAEFLAAVVRQAVAAAEAEIDRDGGGSGEPVRVIIERRSTHPAIPGEYPDNNSTVVRGIDPDDL